MYCYTFMVILLEILNTTQPQLIPRRDVSEEDSWDNREKPLVRPGEKAANKGAHAHAYSQLPGESGEGVPLQHRGDSEFGDEPAACVDVSLKTLLRVPLVVHGSDLEANVGRPGFRNPAFEGDGSRREYGTLILPDGSGASMQKFQDESEVSVGLSKALPRHLVGSVTNLSPGGGGGGVFDSKESADSGISKGSGLPQSSTEDSGAPSGGSAEPPAAENRLQLMKGRAQLDASARRRIFHQESIKNRTNVSMAPPPTKAESRIGDSALVLVHSSFDDNEASGSDGSHAGSHSATSTKSVPLTRVTKEEASPGSPNEEVETRTADRAVSGLARRGRAPDTSDSDCSAEITRF